jgi:predicted permease
VETLLQNIRIGIRSLRRSPSFAAVALLTLAIGIGLSTAVFTVAEALLLRPLPVVDQNRLVVLWGQTLDRRFDNYPTDPPQVREFARRSRALARVAFFGYEGASPTPIREGQRMSRLRRALVSGEFFDVLGVKPVIGRGLRLQDDVIGAAPVVVLSYGTWQHHFGGAPDVLDRQIVLPESGAAHRIVGVMPQGLEFPRGTDFWAPLIPARGAGGKDPPIGEVDIIGRLSLNATPAMARDELTEFFHRGDARPWERNLRGVVHELPQLILGDTRPAVIAFVAAAALLLLITCINVANLLLVRGLARTTEIAVRSALGAARGRIILQLLTENALIALGGGMLGVGLAAVAVQIFLAFAPPGVPRLGEIHPSATALVIALGITGVSTLLFGLAPAVMTAGVEVQNALRGGMGLSVPRGSRGITEGLVAGQIALAVLVLSAAGLITRTLMQLERAPLSLDPSHVLVGELAIRSDQFDTQRKQLAVLDRVLTGVRAVPGVLAVSPVVAVPFAQGWAGQPTVEGQSPEQAMANPVVDMDVVTPSYFTTLGIPVVRGRGFTENDREGAPAAVIVSEGTARAYWPGRDPIGKRFRIGSEVTQSVTVVGVVPDTRYRALRATRPAIYFPLRQSTFPFAPTTLAIRVAGDPTVMVPMIRRAIGVSDANVALTSAVPFESLLDQALTQPRLNALLLSVFAAAAVLLAAVGLFGAMATMVRQRTREMGVRMAVGATPGDLFRMVVQRGLTVAGLGLAVGLLGALAANRLLSAMLYDVSPTDAVTLLGVTALLMLVAGVAVFIPARTSARIDPVLALRTET